MPYPVEKEAFSILLMGQSPPRLYTICGTLRRIQNLSAGNIARITYTKCRCACILPSSDYFPWEKLKLNTHILGWDI